VFIQNSAARISAGILGGWRWPPYLYGKRIGFYEEDLARHNFEVISMADLSRLVPDKPAYNLDSLGPEELYWAMAPTTWGIRLPLASKYEAQRWPLKLQNGQLNGIYELIYADCDCLDE